MESTYGDRNHEIPESYVESLAQLIDNTFARGGNVIIPSLPWAALRSCSTSCGRSSIRAW